MMTMTKIDKLRDTLNKLWDELASCGTTISSCTWELNVVITTLIKFKDTGAGGGDCICVSVGASMGIGVGDVADAGVDVGIVVGAGVDIGVGDGVSIGVVG